MITRKTFGFLHSFNIVIQSPECSIILHKVNIIVLLNLLNTQESKFILLIKSVPMYQSNANKHIHHIPPIRILPPFLNQQIFCHNLVLLLVYFGKLSPPHGQDFRMVAFELISVAVASHQGSWACKLMSEF